MLVIKYNKINLEGHQGLFKKSLGETNCVKIKISLTEFTEDTKILIHILLELLAKILFLQEAPIIKAIRSLVKKPSAI